MYRLLSCDHPSHLIEGDAAPTLNGNAPWRRSRWDLARVHARKMPRAREGALLIVTCLVLLGKVRGQGPWFNADRETTYTLFKNSWPVVEVNKWIHVYF